MLLMQYAAEHNILKTRKAKVSEVRDNGSDVTILYMISGQKYPNGNPSAKNVSKKVAASLEVDDEGYLMSGNILKKNNFWVWEEGASNEA